MKTFTRPFTVSEKARLKQEVAWTPGTVIFGLMCAGLVLKLFHFLVSKFAASFPFFRPFWWWLLPWAALMAFLIFTMESGRKGRKQAKADLLAGNALCHYVDAVEAIEIEEMEDEGQGFFIRTSGGETLFLHGQYLENYVRRKFPWKTFEIVETPESKHFLGLRKLGEPLKPSFVREPLTYQEAKTFGFETFKILNNDFETLKVKPAQAPRQTAAIS